MNDEDATIYPSNYIACQPMILSMSQNDNKQKHSFYLRKKMQDSTIYFICHSEQTIRNN